MNKEEKLKIFAENLRKARENAGLSKPEAAEKLRIKPAQYYRYEAGTAEPGILMAIEIAEMLNITTDELFNGIKTDISKVDYVITKLNGYGIKASAIDGDSEHIEVYIRDFPPSKESLAFMEAVLSVVDDATRQTMKNAFPSAYFRVLFESVDKDTLDKHLQEAFAKIKDKDLINYKQSSNPSTKAPIIKKERKDIPPSNPDDN